MHPYFDKLFFKIRSGFRNCFNAQHCLVTMIEKWLGSVDGGGQGDALLTDFCNTFHCINYELLIVKLCAYGFDKNSLYFINSHLKGLKQITKKISLTVRLLRSFSMCVRVPYWDHSCLIFTSAISFLKLVTLILLIMLIAIHHMPVNQNLMLSFLSFRKTPKEFFKWFCHSDLI